MEAMPDDILKLIFGKFEFHELLVIRKVCRRWEFVIDKSIERRPLWLKKIDDHSNYYRLFGVEKVHERKHFNITYSLLAFRQCTEIHPMLRKVVTYSPFVLIGLQLDNLEHLEIKNRSPIVRSATANLLGILFNAPDEEEQAINLKFLRLRTLAVKARLMVDLVIDAGKLTNLEVIDNLGRIQLLDPKSVTQLSCNKFTSELLSFKNLTKLTVANLEYTNKKLNVNLIKHFGRLRELIVWEMKRASFDKLIKHKQAAPNRELTVYYKSIDIEAEQFDFAVIDRVKGDGLNESSYQTYVTHMDDLKREFNQSSLIIQKDLNVPMTHFAMFRNVRCLMIRTHRLSINNFKLLLQSLKLDDLTIAVTLDQRYLDCLPKYARYLTSLSLETYDNLDFVLQLKCLTRLTVRGFPNIDWLKRLFASTSNLRQLTIYSNNIVFDLRITDTMISLSRERQLVFTDSKDSFLYSSLFYTQSWMQLLNVNGNAKCQYAI